MSQQCLYCEKYYSNKQSLTRHQNTCPSMKLYHANTNLKNEYEKQRIEIDQNQQRHEKQNQSLKEQYEQQIQLQREQHKRELQNQKEEYETRLQNQREQYERELQLQQRQLDKFETQLFEIAKQPKQQQQITNHNNNSQTTNNRILHITNHLIPIETDEEIRRMIDIQYTRDIFLGGSESLKDMTVSILKDQEK